MALGVTMSCRVKNRIIGLSLMPILMLTSAESRSADVAAKLDALFTATLLGLPIGHISWALDLKEERFSSVATGSISGVLRLFLDAQGSVAAEGRLSSGKPVPSKFQLKLLAGKWTDEVGIAFNGNRAKNPCSQPLQIQARTTCRSKTLTAWGPVIR